MKRVYKKPKILVEKYVMDGTIASAASACEGYDAWRAGAENYYIEYLIIEQIIFSGNESIPAGYEIGGEYYNNTYLPAYDATYDGNDGICYHSLANNILQS